MIPNIIHFIFGLEENFGGKPFSFVHFLAVYTAFKIHRPDRIYFHYEYEPSGEWWERAKPFLTLKKLKAPTKIFGNKIKHFAHKADVIRLEQLMQHGGIYLDIDVISIFPFESLRKHNTVMGIEHDAGLCNAVILSRKDAEFISIWYDQYRTFDANQWSYHSVVLPHQLWQKNPQLIHVVSEYLFFYPMHSDPSRIFLWTPTDRENDIKEFSDRIVNCSDPVYIEHLKAGRAWQYGMLCGTFCIHLWETVWFTPYLQHISPESLLTDSSNFSRLMRKIIPHEDLLAMNVAPDDYSAKLHSDQCD